MQKGINGQLNDALDPWLKQIRSQLAPPLPPPPASTGNRAPTAWVSARPTASDYPKDAMGRLDQLINELNKASAIEERDGNVGRLAVQMRASKSIADELGDKHKFDSIRLAVPGKKALAFSRIRECVDLASQYYERLAYYKTPQGKDFLRGVTSVGLDLDRPGDVAVRDHNFHERIDPLAGLRRWQYDAYLSFAEGRREQKADPLDHFVDFLIDVTKQDGLLISRYLDGGATVQGARIHPARSFGSLLDVKVLTHVPSHERFKAPGQPRMWTYQVKVATKLMGEPHGWEWSADVFSDGTVSLPVLQVIHSGAARRPSMMDQDFTRGTLYAMKGVTAMRCFPASKFHSALYEGDVVSAAGMLVADHGRVIAIDNRSGHYQPGFPQLATAVRFLKSNLLFEPDAFVSVFAPPDDALYFEPDDFLTAAQRSMNFRVVADFVAKRMRDYGHLPVPVAPRYADLIPPLLRRFPRDKGRNRWDRMLTCYYGGLETIVHDLRSALQSAAPGKAGWVSGHLDLDRVRAHGMLAEQTLKALDAGGAYCRLADLVGKLMIATQRGKHDNRGLLEAHVRYRSIMERLSILGPSHGTV